MKTNATSLSVLSTLVLAALLVVSILKIQQVHAQVDATTSDTVATTSELAPPAPEVLGAATSAAASTDTTTVQTDASAATSDTVAPAEPPPQGLTEVHIVGTKYTDYFTDGTTVTSYPGDPAIDSNFDKPNAPIPTHEGLTWVHTTGGYKYDTPSGDLEAGDYAVQPSGSYITNAPPFVSSTSSPAVLGASTSTSDMPSDTPSTSTTTPTPIDTIAPTTTSTDSTTTSSSQ